MGSRCPVPCGYPYRGGRNCTRYQFRPTSGSGHLNGGAYFTGGQPPLLPQVRAKTHRICPTRSVGHLATPLVDDYSANGLLVEVGPEWSLNTILHTIGKGTHSSTLSPESTAFYRREIMEQTQWGFSIFLQEEDAI